MLAALTVFYRDFKHIVPFLVQIMMYVTPVIYPAKLVGPRWQLLLSLNPMFGIVTAYRSAILGTPWNFAFAGDLDGVGPSVVCVFAVSTSAIPSGVSPISRERGP